MPKWKFIFTHAGKSFGKDNCSILAAGISYYVLVSIFPIAVFLVSIAGFLLRNDPTAEQRVIDSLVNNLPLSEAEGRAQLASTLNAVTSTRAGLGLIGLIGSAWSASSLFGVIRTAICRVLRVERERPLVQGKLLDLGMVVGVGLLLVLSFALTAALAVARRLSGEWFPEIAGRMEFLFTVVNFVLPPLVSFLTFSVLFWASAVPALRWRQTWPGAIVTAVLFEVLKVGFSIYVANFGNYNAVYGTIGFVIAFLAFAYFTAQIILLGAEVVRSYVGVTTGTLPAVQPALPKRSQPLAQRVLQAVRGLWHKPDRTPKLTKPPAITPAQPLSETANPPMSPRGFSWRLLAGGLAFLGRNR